MGLEKVVNEISENSYLSYKEQKQYIKNLVNKIKSNVNKILIIPPDISRKHAGGGQLTEILYHLLTDKNKLVEIMPALGTHDPMSKEKLIEMFGDKIPLEKFRVHNWREDTIEIGKIPVEYVSEVTENQINQSISVMINKSLVRGEYDLIISIGQVVPHEVVGMANYTKNILVGVGGFEIISVSHFVGAVAGVENIMGCDHSSVRKLYDYAENNLLNNLPLLYILTVNSIDIIKDSGLTRMLGIFSGRNRDIFEKAVELSQKVNIIEVEKPFNKIIVYLDPKEFKTTWLGGKGIYRTRKALADGGEIILIAPGLNKFGEDKCNDHLIRKYGYVGTKKILKLVKENEELQNNLAAAAHMIQGSSEGRFKITVACKDITEEEIKNVNFNYLSLEKAIEKYDIDKMNPGVNIIDGEVVLYVENPATGLWIYKD